MEWADGLEESRKAASTNPPTAESDLLSPSVADYGALAGLSQMKKWPWDHCSGDSGTGSCLPRTLEFFREIEVSGNGVVVANRAIARVCAFYSPFSVSMSAIAI